MESCWPAKMTRKRWLLLGLAVAVAIGIAVGAAATWMALDHNPQGEFFDTQTGEIHLAATAPRFFCQAYSWV